MADTTFNVRLATRDDMPQVFEYIKALAKFEKLENELVITAETLIKDGFESDSPAFTCFVAETTDLNIIGYSLYYIFYSTALGKTIFLEDIYVDKAYRNLGVGQQLFLAVAKIALETGQSLSFHVLSWNPAAEFYKKFGAVNLTDTQSQDLFRLDKIALKNLFP